MDTMVDTQPATSVLIVSPSSLTEAFHRINSLIPDEDPVTIRPTTTVAEATRIMRERRFSQLPVVEGSEVLGVFSYRSLIEQLLTMADVPDDWSSLPVDEFLETIPFLHIFEELETASPHLDQWDAVLVGQPDRLDGVVTPMDVLRHVYNTAIPFIQLAEIELAVRGLIRACVDEDELRSCAERSRREKDKGKELPASLEDMTFDHYVQIIGDGRNWPLFTPAFGAAGDWHRTRVRTKLLEIRDLRNDTFHFKRRLTDEDRAVLSSHRDWLLRKVRSLEASRGGAEVGHAG